MMTREASAPSMEGQTKGSISNEGFSYNTQMSPDNSELFPLSELNMGRLDPTAFTIPAVKQENAFQQVAFKTPLKTSTTAVPQPQYHRSYSLNAIGIDPKELIYVKDSNTNQIYGMRNPYAGYAMSGIPMAGNTPISNGIPMNQLSMGAPINGYVMGANGNAIPVTSGISMTSMGPMPNGVHMAGTMALGQMGANMPISMVPNVVASTIPLPSSVGVQSEASSTSQESQQSSPTLTPQQQQQLLHSHQPQQQHHQPHHPQPNSPPQVVSNNIGSLLVPLKNLAGVIGGLDPSFRQGIHDTLRRLSTEAHNSSFGSPDASREQEDETSHRSLLERALSFSLIRMMMISDAGSFTPVQVPLMPVRAMPNSSGMPDYSSMRSNSVDSHRFTYGYSPLAMEGVQPLVLNPVPTSSPSATPLAHAMALSSSTPAVPPPPSSQPMLSYMQFMKQYNPAAMYAQQIPTYDPRAMMNSHIALSQQQSPYNPSTQSPYNPPTQSQTQPTHQQFETSSSTPPQASTFTFAQPKPVLHHSLSSETLLSPSANPRKRRMSSSDRTDPVDIRQNEILHQHPRDRTRSLGQYYVPPTSTPPLNGLPTIEEEPTTSKPQIVNITAKSTQQSANQTSTSPSSKQQQQQQQQQSIIPVNTPTQQQQQQQQHPTYTKVDLSHVNDTMTLSSNILNTNPGGYYYVFNGTLVKDPSQQPTPTPTPM